MILLPAQSSVLPDKVTILCFLISQPTVIYVSWSLSASRTLFFIFWRNLASHCPMNLQLISTGYWKPLSPCADKDHNFRYQIALQSPAKLSARCVIKTKFIVSLPATIWKVTTPRTNFSKVHHSFMKTVSRAWGIFYADRLCISTKYLHRNLPQYCNGASAKQIIDQHVILEIKVLLQSTGIKYAGNSRSSGFSRPILFGRYFKRMKECHREITENSRYITTNRPVNEVSIGESVRNNALIINAYKNIPFYRVKV